MGAFKTDHLHPVTKNYKLSLDLKNFAAEPAIFFANFLMLARKITCHHRPYSEVHPNAA